MDTFTVLDAFRVLDSKFHKSCHQIRLLNRYINEIQIRYDRALQANQRSFCNNLRLRLVTYEGVRNMYHEYARRRAEELETMQVVLTQRELMIGDEDTDSDPEIDGLTSNNTLYSDVEGHESDSNSGREDSETRIDDQETETDPEIDDKETETDSEINDHDNIFNREQDGQENYIDPE